jgi:uncharacterized protein
VTPTILRAADRRAVPWKNGGGVTREVAAWPPGSGFDDFAWRVSMAEVREAGPFSRFAGVDRILAVVEGALRLAVQNAGVFELSPRSAPLAFDGEVATSAELILGPALDLNVMTRRGAACAQVIRAVSATDLAATPGWRLIVALADQVRVLQDEHVEDLLRYDAMLTDASVTLEASAVAPALVISLTSLEGPFGR